jgi:hypothetical protein
LIIIFVLVKSYSYLCGMKTILLMNLVLGILVLSAALIIGVSLMILKYFPTSKVSGWIRRHLITDVDLESINDESSEQD